MTVSMKAVRVAKKVGNRCFMIFIYSYCR